VKEGWILPASQAKGRVPGGFWTRVEMLVEPPVGGAEDARVDANRSAFARFSRLLKNSY